VAKRPHYKEELKRLSLTLPSSLYDEFIARAKEKNLALVEGVRQAIALWLEQQIAAEMEEGYKAIAEESLALMEEFKYVDQECWE